MNWLALVSGLFALIAVIGHFTMGIKLFLKPMMDATFDEVPKKTMQTVFHYVSIFQAVSAVALILVGFGVSFNLDSILMIRFIALNYSLFAVALLFIALTSNMPSPLTKLSQWTFWIIIAVLSWVGA